MDTLQINLRPKKVYSITQGGINITTFTNPKLPTESHIPFENIKSDRFFYIHKSPFLVIAAGVFALIYFLILADALKNHTNYHFINLGWALFSLILFSSYFLLRPRSYFIKTTTGRFIKFKISKNEKEVSSFVETLIEKRNVYLKLRYGTPNSYLSYDAQFSNFNILFREGIITMEEYQRNIEVLNNTFEQTVPKQTYSQYSQN